MLFKKFNEQEAWQYILKNMPLIKHRLYKRNVYFNRDDILQDTLILIFNKISNRTLSVTQNGYIVGFHIITDNAIKDVLKTKYKYASIEFPTDKIYSAISSDVVW